MVCLVQLFDIDTDLLSNWMCIILKGNFSSLERDEISDLGGKIHDDEASQRVAEFRKV